MKLKNPVIFWSLVLFVILNIADIITAKFILAGEANPLYIKFGSMLPVIAVKIIVIGIMIYIYNRNIFNNVHWYYLYVMFIILGVIGVSLGVAANTYGILNPTSLAESANIPSAEKVQAYNLFVLFIIYLPAIFSYIIFVIYNASVKKARIGKHHWKGTPWYKRF